MESKKGLRLALIGTDSLRGKEMKNLLSETRFPFERIDFFDADVKKEYSKLTLFQEEPRVIHSLDDDLLLSADLVFLAAEKKVSRKYGILACQKKYQAIDLSESFNEDEKIPLVVAGVNDESIQKDKRSLVSNPHPVTIILSHLFHLSIKSFGLLKAIAFVLQPASAFDKSGIEELASQSVAMLNSSSLPKTVFNEQIAFNFLCQLDPADRDGFSSIERQIIHETQRVFEDGHFPFSLSLIQAPVFHTYSIMTYLELKKNADLEELKSLFEQSPYFELSPSSLSCPVSSISIAGKDRILVGQIKREVSFPNGFWIWTVADNLTRGSSLNALEVALKLFLPQSA